MSGERSWLDRRGVEVNLAFSFLTRLPTRRLENLAGVRIADCIWVFPIVGLMVGACAALIFGIASDWLASPRIAALVAIAFTMLVTGALHEDGLADFADGIGGGRTRERKLEIMRDSRIGTYGALALLVSVLLRVECLADIELVPGDRRADGGSLRLAGADGAAVPAAVAGAGGWALTGCRTAGLAAGRVCRRAGNTCSSSTRSRRLGVFPDRWFRQASRLWSGHRRRCRARRRAGHLRHRPSLPRRPHRRCVRRRAAGSGGCHAGRHFGSGSSIVIDVGPASAEVRSCWLGQAPSRDPTSR